MGARTPSIQSQDGRIQLKISLIRVSTPTNFIWGKIVLRILDREWALMLDEPDESACAEFVGEEFRGEELHEPSPIHSRFRDHIAPAAALK